MNSTTYRQLRDRFKTTLQDNELVVLMSGTGIRKSADAQYPFHANRNFVYLTGIEEPEAILMMNTKTDEEILFLRDIDPFMEKWVGRFMTKEQAQEISGIEDVRYFVDFEEYFEKNIEQVDTIGLDLDHDSPSDLFYGSGVNMQEELEGFPVYDVFPKLVECRTVKHEDEIEAIKHAAVVTNTAIENMLKEMKPNGNEQDMAARFLYEGQKRNGSLMFDTIVAGGANATVLHYIENNQKLQDGDLVLVDLGICVNHYGADISRTFPINGQFTQRQKEVYSEVLNTFKYINDSVKPGISILELNNLAKVSLGEACIRLGLIDDIKDVDQYYYHSIGHSLGLDTHDVWLDREAPLVPGNVITNEPGLYIAEEGIGVRLETDLLVTKDGNDDLAPQILIEINDIEKLLYSMNNQ
ncbi:aminopeptidase P family protein [Erysipelothrix urinaevulpis]|uniref:aminopeptidase P family protein n=1 Tax=Erysipelothrix urinaevulpis TaxID=2683717 RepID=UPI00135A6179|nr:aminopeptidase P family protein [Erysipelothrix urinaevulpis]